MGGKAGIDGKATTAMSKSRKRKQRAAKKKTGKKNLTDDNTMTDLCEQNKSSHNNNDDDWLTDITQEAGKGKKTKKKPKSVLATKVTKASNLRWLQMLAKVVAVLKNDGELTQTHTLHSWLVSQRKLWDQGMLEKNRCDDLSKLAVYQGFSWMHNTLLPKPFFIDLLKRRHWSLEEVTKCPWVKTHVDLAHKGLLPEWARRHIAALSKDPRLGGGDDLDLSSLSFTSAEDLDLSALNF